LRNQYKSGTQQELNRYPKPCLTKLFQTTLSKGEIALTFTNVIYLLALPGPAPPAALSAPPGAPLLVPIENVSGTFEPAGETLT
jgi:hypothetical protein